MIEGWRALQRVASTLKAHPMLLDGPSASAVSVLYTAVGRKPRVVPIGPSSYRITITTDPRNDTTRDSAGQ